MSHPDPDILLAPFHLSEEARVAVESTLKGKVVPGPAWASIEAAGARYGREREQERLNPRTSRARTKALLQKLADASEALRKPLTHLAETADDERNPDANEAAFALACRRFDPQQLDEASELVAALATASREALQNFGETRGRDPELYSLSRLVADLAVVWRGVTGQRVTLDRHKIEDKLVPISDSYHFFRAVLISVDPEVTGKQLATIIQSIRG